MRVAFLPFSTLELEWAPGRHPAELKKAIEQDAAKIAERRGQEYQVSTAGQTVTLGRRHATKKKSSAQLQREIDEALRASDRAKHGYDTDPISDREFEQSARFDAKKYGLTLEEALRFVKHPRYLSIRDEVERWRERHGFPAANSSLTRSYLLDRIRAR